MKLAATTSSFVMHARASTHGYPMPESEGVCNGQLKNSMEFRYPLDNSMTG